MSADDQSALGRIIWTTSRADESTISATGANIVADAILASDWLAERNAKAWEEGAPLIRRAINDPGSFVKRGPDYDGEPYGERLDQWQARAMTAAIEATR